MVVGKVGVVEYKTVDVDLVYLGKDDLDDVGWASGVDDPKTLDIHLGSRSLDILQVDEALWMSNPAN